MEHRSDVMVSLRRLIRLYEMGLDEIRRKYGLTMIEITIVGFLHNNPSLDTAADIAEIRMLPKGNVSQGVEALISKALLTRERDEADRRKIHLALQEAAAPIVAEISEANRQYLQTVYQGISEEEKVQYQNINHRIMENVTAAFTKNLERRQRGNDRG